MKLGPRTDPVREMGALHAWMMGRLASLEIVAHRHDTKVEGILTAATDVNGYVTIPFGVTFDSLPNVQVTPASTNCSQGHLQTLTTSSVRFRCFSAAGAALASVEVTLHWRASTSEM